MVTQNVVEDVLLEKFVTQCHCFSTRSSVSVFDQPSDGLLACRNEISQDKGLARVLQNYIKFIVYTSYRGFIYRK